MCVGRDASQIAALNDDLQRAFHGVGRNGATIYALSGIDIALCLRPQRLQPAGLGADVMGTAQQRGARRRGRSC